MSLKLMAIILGGSFIIIILLLKGFKMGKKLFANKPLAYVIVAILLMGLSGLNAFLVRDPVTISRSSLVFMLGMFFLFLGMLHVALAPSFHPWVNKDKFLRFFGFTLGLTLVGGAIFFLVFYLIERKSISPMGLFADNFTMSILLFPVPFFVVKAYEYWKEIPERVIEAWLLPVDEASPFIEPGRALILHFNIPIKFDSREVIRINTRAPIERTIGEIFHYLLYRHNVEQRSIKKIEIAEESSRHKVYGWLFYKQTSQFYWWTQKKYISPTTKIKNARLRNGEVIHVKRIKVWKMSP